MTLHAQQEQLCQDNKTDYRHLRTLLINTTLEKRVENSHTQRLLDVVREMMQRAGAKVEALHMLSYDVPPGVYPDMTKHGWDKDDWHIIWEKVQAADILVVGTPIWLGEESSVCRLLIDRLYGMSAELNSQGQSVFYNKVGGCVVTGNEDGMKHVAMSVIYSLMHLGYTIPPQADCGWVGEAGPGPSYGDDLEDGTRAGFANEFTQRNTTIMTWNLLHLARMLKQAGGISNHGNDRNKWQAGCRFGYANPEHRR